MWGALCWWVCITYEGSVFYRKMHNKVMEHFKGWSKLNVGHLIKSCHIRKFFGYDAIKLNSHFSCYFLFMKTLS